MFPQEFVIDHIRVYELNTTAIEPGTASGGAYSLEQNFPNPFGLQTKILYTIAEAGQVTLEVFDALGRRVETLVDEVKEAGRHQVELDGSKFPPGLYSYRLITGSYSGIKQMVLL